MTRSPTPARSQRSSIPHRSRRSRPSLASPTPRCTPMRGLWDQINHDEAKQAPTVEKLARSTESNRGSTCFETGAAWLRAPGRSVFPHDHLVTRLAEVMRDTASPLDQLRALARHHHEHGGGRRWFREQAGKVVPLVADTGIAASDYRFRLRSLGRLAAQCGVANMKSRSTPSPGPSRFRCRARAGRRGRRRP